MMIMIPMDLSPPSARTPRLWYLGLLIMYVGVDALRLTGTTHHAFYAHLSPIVAIATARGGRLAPRLANPPQWDPVASHRLSRAGAAVDMERHTKNKFFGGTKTPSAVNERGEREGPCC